MSQKRAAVARGTRAEQPSTLSTEAAAAEVYEGFARYVASAESREAAAAAARADLREAAEEIVRLSRGTDPIAVLSSLHVAMIMESGTSGIEPSAAALELTALVLLPSRASVVTTDDGADTAFMPPQIAAAARRAVAAGSMIALFDSPSSDVESTIVFYSVQREIHLRNAVYPHMLLDTLRGLFTEPAVMEDCRAVLGFTGEQAVDIVHAVGSVMNSQVADRFARVQDARDASLPYLQQWQERDRGGQGPRQQEHRAAAQRVVDAIEDLTTNITRATVVDLDVIAARTGHTRPVVQSVLNAFTLSGLDDVDDVLDRFFRGDNVLRTAPLIADAHGRRMLVHDALALPAVREVVETRLKAAGRKDAYEHHRGAWVETTAIDLLARVFPTATTYRGFNYFVPDPRAATPQSDPRSFTKRVEADGLILVDDVALIIEVKSVALTAEARGGVARRLRGKLRDIVTAAANQAERLRRRIVDDGSIRLDDGESIDVSGVREIHTIAVGLEDLSGVTTATATLIQAGILAEDNIPWTVSVHDLRVVSELVERPSELLLHLRRRTHPKATWKYRAVDELDLFLTFLDRGLYVEPDPHEVARTLPWSGPPPEEDLRRYASQHPEVLSDRTGPLDAWYHAQLDPDAPKARKPKLIADRRLLRLVEQLAATESPGWLSTAASLLEGNGQVQHTFGRYAADLARLTRRDRTQHSLTHLMGETSGRHVLLVWVCRAPGESEEPAASDLSSYLAAKKHQTGAYRATCMLFDPTGKKLLWLIYNNLPPTEDPVLDAAAARLVPLENMQRATPGPVRPSTTSH
jgi:hypothetical protein